MPARDRGLVGGAVADRSLVGPVGRLDVQRPPLGLLRPAALDEGDHVGLADPSADSRALDLGEVDPVLVGDPPHDRRVETERSSSDG